MLFDLVHRLVVEVRDAGVHAQDGLGDGEFVFAGLGVVVDEGAGQVGFAVVAGGEGDFGFAVVVAGRRPPCPVGLQVGLQGFGAGEDVVEGGAGEGEDGAGGDGFGGEFPDAVGVGEGGFAEVVAVGEGAQDGVVAVGAGAGFGDFAVGDEEDLVGGGAEFDEGVAGVVVLLGEPAGEFGEDVFVVVAA
ncbi:hypothetical protein H4696_000474 [Amycolatopsis lexingtonensis]|uniref:Uncharacterized protein n=1 Tax=Amycolatopsis lexingtonensis TaxID=218822 RepID=A0ABR9HR26_9PSEU|nr:hypothetical protein [Amycolatopsis lexingtonensis]